MQNNRRIESRRIFHLKCVFLTALIFIIIGSILLIVYKTSIAQKWDLSPKMVLTFAIITAVVTLLGIVGAIRLNNCLVLSFAIYMTIVSLVVIILALTRHQLIPVVVLVLVTTGSAFIYFNALRKVIKAPEGIHTDFTAIDLNRNKH